MTAKEMRDAGMLYSPDSSGELRKEYARAAELVYRLNSLRLSETKEREAVMKSLFGSMGSRCRIISPFHCDFGYNIHVGGNFFANSGLVILDTARVSIGNNVLIGPQVGIYAAYHPLDAGTRTAGLEAAKAITICDNVWIGGHASILPGVTIGEGSVVGAGSVVTRDIPPGVVAAGNPCRVIRHIENNGTTLPPEAD